MKDEILEKLRYPVGRFKKPTEISTEDLTKWIDEIRNLPYNLRVSIAGFRDKDFDIPYRPKGWNSRQVIHHLADSHMNSIIRFKLALTEDNPTIKPYDQNAWAELPDSKEVSPEVSIKILDAVHQRWTSLLDRFTKKDWKRTFSHPEWKAPFSLEEAVALYAWHGKHHIGHIQSVKKG